MPEWLKGADCKSAGESLRWFESISAHHLACGWHFVRQSLILRAFVRLWILSVMHGFDWLNGFLSEMRQKSGVILSRIAAGI